MPSFIVESIIVTALIMYEVKIGVVLIFVTRHRTNARVNALLYYRY